MKLLLEITKRIGLIKQFMKSNKLSLLSLALSFVALMLSFRVVSVDFKDYWGFVLGVLSLLVTILIGWQIFNWMGLKDDVAVVNARMDELGEKIKQVDGKIKQVDKQIIRTKSMELDRIINLSSGSESTVSLDNRVFANSSIETTIYNRSDSDIYIMSFEFYDNVIDEQHLLYKKRINKTIKGKGFSELERYTRESFYFEFSAIPVIVWTFTYDDFTYVASCLWNDYKNVSLIAKKKNNPDQDSTQNLNR